MKKILNVIKTTHNGYIIDRKKITDITDKSIDDIFDILALTEVKMKYEEPFCYLDDKAGSYDDLEKFLRDHSNINCSTKYHGWQENTLMETWLTEVVGSYPGNEYIGLEIQTIA